MCRDAIKTSIFSVVSAITFKQLQRGFKGDADMEGGTNPATTIKGTENINLKCVVNTIEFEEDIEEDAGEHEDIKTDEVFTPFLEKSECPNYCNL